MTDVLPVLIDEETREVLRKLYEQHERLMYKCEAAGNKQLGWYHCGAMTAIRKVQGLLDGEDMISDYLPEYGQDD